MESSTVVRAALARTASKAAHHHQNRRRADSSLTSKAGGPPDLPHRQNLTAGVCRRDGADVPMRPVRRIASTNQRAAGCRSISIPVMLQHLRDGDSGRSDARGDGSTSRAWRSRVSGSPSGKTHSGLRRLRRLIAEVGEGIGVASPFLLHETAADQAFHGPLKTG